MYFLISEMYETYIDKGNTSPSKLTKGNLSITNSKTNPIPQITKETSTSRTKTNLKTFGVLKTELSFEEVSSHIPSSSFLSTLVLKKELGFQFK
mmetsp:Transcript_7571/g.11147  ORF Transcript_7571/g.11147 Transcript_7571/m.11147 type:complete len:94 (-) Transcript_7571:2503-2784(-)